jgi:maltose/moltooligosaccharide transporter
MVCLVIGGVSLMSIMFIHNLNLLMAPMIGVGIAWASILTMPYAILAATLPAHRMGFYMGVFNFFIVIPQIVSGLLLGFVTKHLFSGHAASTLALGGASMIIGGLLSLAVREPSARRAAMPEALKQAS